MVPVSPGELLDKLTILEIKSNRITDPDKRANVDREYTELVKVACDHIAETDELLALRSELKAVNERLWDIEDDIRECERRQDFGQKFIGLARAVYVTNDRRAALKKAINTTLGSRLSEEKSYQAY